MSAVVVATVLLPLTGAAAAGLAPGSRWLQRVISIGVAGGVLGLGGVLLAAAADGTIPVAAVGGWPHRFAIVLVADPLAALLVTVTGLIALSVLLSAAAAGDDQRRFFHPLVLVLVAGACGTFLTGDLFNLFVWFEVTLIASYVLASLDGTDRQVAGAAVYVATNLLGSLLLLVGVGVTYAVAGSVNLAVLARQTGAEADALLVPGALLVVAFGVKSALVPLGGWLAVTYPRAPHAVAALFAGLLTTVGVVALYRVSAIVHGGRRELVAVLLAAACVTAVVAAVAALGQRPLRDLLAYVVVTQVGLMLVGIGLFGAAAVAAGIFFLVQDVVAKTAVFLIAGSTEGDRARPPGPGRVRPVLAATFLVAGLSLAGVPPTGGFAGKALLVEAALAGGRWAVAATILVASLLTGLAIVAGWHRAFVSEREPATPSAAGSFRLGAVGRAAPAAVLTLAVVAVGLAPAPLYGFAERAATVLVDRTAYVEAVLP